MRKYPIDRELFPFTLLVPPINEKFLKLAAKHMNPPGKFLNAKNSKVTLCSCTGSDGAAVPFYVIRPESAKENSPCLFYVHGGGFVLKAAGYHYMNSLRYAEETGCTVIFPDYRLAPENPFPVFYEDVYTVFCHIYDNHEEYGIDVGKIGLGGDSAGATLAVGLRIMAKERNHPASFIFELLMYPYLDARNESESAKKYTDTPMWNSSLSERIGPMTRVQRTDPHYRWYSPVESDDFSIFPPTYIETAEFDCLHDDGILFAEELKDAGIKVELNETKGTMHGYDIRTSAGISKDSMKKRIEFIRKYI